jgi:hypothetical protein
MHPRGVRDAQRQLSVWACKERSPQRPNSKRNGTRRVYTERLFWRSVYPPIDRSTCAIMSALDLSRKLLAWEQNQKQEPLSLVPNS